MEGSEGLVLWFVGIVAWKYIQTFKVKRPSDAKGYDQLVGNTPLIELRRLSALFGVKMLAKVSDTSTAINTLLTFTLLDGVFKSWRHWKRPGGKEHVG